MPEHNTAHHGNWKQDEATGANLETISSAFAQFSCFIQLGRCNVIANGSP